MEITSVNNLFIKQLKKEKAKNRFLLFLDTPILIEEALNHNLTLKHVLIQKDKQYNFVSKFRDKVIFVSKEVLAQLSSVVTSAGVLGVFEFEKKPYKAPQGNYLVLDNVQDAGNVGTLLRTALAANFKTVFLLDCASITNEKVIRSSAGALFSLFVHEMTRKEFLQNFTLNNLYVADMDGKNIFKEKPNGNIGLALGNEGNGVSEEIVKAAQGKIVSLPMENNLESLNVAVSGAIIMYLINFGG